MMRESGTHHLVRELANIDATTKFCIILLIYIVFLKKGFSWLVDTGQRQI